MERLEGGDASAVNQHPTPTAEVRRRFFALVRAGARHRHVGVGGDDAGPGTATRPFATISRALADAEPGDVVHVGPGTYGYTAVRGFRGRPDAWLAIVSASEAEPARIHVPGTTDNLLEVIGSSYVGLFGLEVCGDLDEAANTNTNASAISVFGASHHVAVWACHVHHVPGGGINCFDVNGSHDALDIRHNRVHTTSRLSPMNTSGISVHAPRHLTEPWPDGYGHRVVGNYVHDVQCLVPFTPGGIDVVTDGNGISIDLLTANNYARPTLVAGNVVVGNGGRGVHAFSSLGVLVRGNVALGNLRTPSPAITGGAELDGDDAEVTCVGNAVLPVNVDRWRDETSTYRATVMLGGAQAVDGDNTDARELGWGAFARALELSDLSGGMPVTAWSELSGHPRLERLARELGPWSWAQRRTTHNFHSE